MLKKGCVTSVGHSLNPHSALKKNDRATVPLSIAIVKTFENKGVT